MLTPPANELIASAPWLNAIPLPLATELIVTPVEPAKVPADKAPVIEIASLLVAAVLVVVRVAQPKQVLSKRI